MKKIKIIAPLVHFLQQREAKLRIILGKKNEVKTTSYQNRKVKIIDSSLIPCLKASSIRMKHKGDVTVRNNKMNKKYYIGGVKLFTIMENGVICKTDVTNINYAESFINYLKQNVTHFKNTVLLADRGFNKLSTFLQNNLKTFKLISPQTGRNCRKLNEKEKVLYETKWEVEIVYLKLKDLLSLGEYKLNPTFKYNRNIVEATIYYNIFKFNYLNNKLKEFL